MKTRKIIGGVLGCLMLCGLLVGCSGNNSNSNSNYQKGTVTESGFTSEWMGIQYTLPYRVSPLIKRATEPLQDKNFTSCHIAIQRMSMELKQQLHKPFYAKRKKIE